jgi:hypothetical protein
MSDRQQLAEHGTGLAVYGLAALGVVAEPLVPLAVLAAWGIDRYRSCSERKQRFIIDNVIRQIEKTNPNHRAVGPALTLLRENRHRVAITPAVLADAQKRGDFPGALYEMVFTGVDVPKDDGVETLLRMILTAAWQELRKEADYHKVFVEESVTALERDLADGFRRIEGRLAAIKSDTRALLSGQDETHAMLQELLRRTGGFPAAMEKADTLALEELKILAQAFGETEFATKPELIAFLAVKAVEYRGYRASIDALDERLAAIQNLKGAAQDAAARLDFAEVETLLSRVDEVETEIASDTKVARAKNALLRNDSEAAFTLLSAAADSFRSVDPLEPARRRENYANLLYQHGLRYSGGALMLAGRMVENALSEVFRESDQDLWAKLKVIHGSALGNLGRRAGDTAALKAAIGAFCAVLEVWTRDANPMQWAKTQNNLGSVLALLGSLDGETNTLEEAIAAFRAALTVFSRENSPKDWAGTQDGLANALGEVGIRTEVNEMFVEAISSYRAALEVFTRDDWPLDWAATQSNIGIAVHRLGARTKNISAMHDAVAAFRAALEVRTQEASPMDWAITQNSLGSALVSLANLTGDADVLQDAIHAFQEVIVVRPRDTAAFPYAQTMENLAIAHLARAKLRDAPARTTDLASALEAITSALTIYTPEYTPKHHKNAVFLRQYILSEQHRDHRQP